ncbi:MAG TPA: DMT family transporter [bacterium]|nr:DMT family transporter [Candidatus Omnitrophota bacterium]HOL96564.1 DMT family transporter [bacterium]HPP02814.1 DMT family transporter [bacterium]HXK94300.1 DMT family transporter [bacterium]
MPKTIHIKATLALGSSVLLWAAVPLFLRSFTDDIDGWVANGARYGFATLIWAIPLLRYISRGQVNRQVLRLAIVPSLINILAQTFLAWTVYYMEPGLVMFLTRISLVFTILASFALFADERALIRSSYFWWGLALLTAGFLGMYAMQEAALTKAAWTGLWIVLGHSVFVAFYGVAVRHYMRGIQPWHSFAVICVYTTAGLLVIMFAWGNPGELLDMGFEGLSLLALSSLIGIAFAHVTFYYSLEYLGASISSGCQLAVPFFTTAGSYFLFGERFTLSQWIAGIGLLAGAVLLLMAQRHLGPVVTPSARVVLNERDWYHERNP